MDKITEARKRFREEAASSALEIACKAEEMFGTFNSAHEGFAVLWEEFDELKEHVWTNSSRRDVEAMRKEALQVAAMALTFVAEICDIQRGKK